MPIPIQSKARILIVDDDPNTRSDLLWMLKPMDYSVMCAKGLGRALLEDVVTTSRSFRPHVAIVDVRLLDEYRDDRSGIDLLKHLQSAQCILYSAYLTAEVVRLTRDEAVTWVSKSESPQRLLDEVASAVRRICATYKGLTRQLPLDWESQQIVDAIFGPGSDIPPDVVDDILGLLFSDSRQIVLRTVGDTAASLVFAARSHSVILRAWPGNRLEPLMVKLAPAGRIQTEADNYHQHIKGNLRGRFHTALDGEIATFWDLGGVLYSFLGASAQNLVTFARFYEEQTDPREIVKPLEHFFGTVCDDLYRHRIDLDQPLFYAYDRLFGLEKLLSDPTLAGEYLSLPGIPVSLPHPVPWVLQHKDSVIPNASQAVTHGDLHGDNLLVDGTYAWPIDFEHSGPGPILRDFVRLEVDILTRLVPIPQDDLSGFCRLCLAAVEPLELTTASEPVTRSLSGSQARKPLEVIRRLRRLAHKATGYADSQEYAWGLLLDALYTASLPSTSPSQKTRTLLLGAVLCDRLQHWGAEDWPPPDWLQVRLGAVAVDPDLAVIRDLLLAAFTESTLRQLVKYSSNQVLRKLELEFSATDGMIILVAKTIDYCQRHNLLRVLLDEVKRANPDQYGRFEPRLPNYGVTG